MSVISTCGIDVFCKQTVFHIRVNNAVIESVTSALPAQHTDFSFWNVPRDAVLDDPKFNEPSAVDLMLGAGMFIHSVLNER